MGVGEGKSERPSESVSERVKGRGKGRRGKKEEVRSCGNEFQTSEKERQSVEIIAGKEKVRRPNRQRKTGIRREKERKESTELPLELAQSDTRWTPNTKARPSMVRLVHSSPDLPSTCQILAPVNNAHPHRGQPDILISRPSILSVSVDGTDIRSRSHPVNLGTGNHSLYCRGVLVIPRADRIDWMQETTQGTDL